MSYHLHADIKDDSTRVEELWAKIRTLDEEEDSDSTIFYVETMLSLSKQENYPAATAFALSVLGWQHQINGNYPKALDHFFKSLHIYEELNDKEGILKCLGFIGVLHDTQGNHEKALTYYFDALQIAENVNDTLNVSIQLNNIAIAYTQLESFSKAKEYYLRVIELNRQLNFKDNLARNLVNLGILYEQDITQQGNAMLCYKEALDLCEELDLNIGAAYCKQGLASVYLSLKQYGKAEENLMDALKIAEHSNITDLKSGINNLLSDMYAQKGQYKLAHYYYQKHIGLKDSLYNAENVKQLGEIEMNYKMEKQKAENEFKYNKLEYELAAENARRKQLQYFLLLSVFLCFVILFFAKRTYDSKKKLEKKTDELTITNAQLKEMDDYKEKLFNLQRNQINGKLKSKEKEVSSGINMLIYNENQRKDIQEKLKTIVDTWDENSRDKLKSLVFSLKMEDNNQLLPKLSHKFEGISFDFYEKLNNRFPNITKNEKTLSVYLLIGLPPAEIAVLTKKSLNSINVAFLRLREKLDQPSNKELKEFLHELHSV
jgi:tetratricopeptide (TPR) repeat protein